MRSSSKANFWSLEATRESLLSTGTLELLVTLYCSHGRRRLLTPAARIQACSGLIPDARHFTSRARNEASSWRKTYHGPIPVSSLADRMGQYTQAYTLYSSVRPFGVTAIIGGLDEEGGPSLWMVEPSGVGWVRDTIPQPCNGIIDEYGYYRVTTVPQLDADVKQLRLSSRNSIFLTSHSRKVSSMPRG